MTVFDESLHELIERDERYPLEAYEFIFHALHHAQKMFDRLPADEPLDAAIGAGDSKHHVSGPELLDGVRDLALQEFGFMARTVFRMWGTNRTEDWGNIVFNLIDAGMMSKTDNDSLDDFRDVYDMDEALIRGFRIELNEVKD
jgi:uncharacterized repeat protein (TIGR04138 family)